MYVEPTPMRMFLYLSRERKTVVRLKKETSQADQIDKDLSFKNLFILVLQIQHLDKQ